MTISSLEELVDESDSCKHTKISSLYLASITYNLICPRVAYWAKRKKKIYYIFIVTSVVDKHLFYSKIDEEYLIGINFKHRSILIRLLLIFKR